MCTDTLISNELGSILFFVPYTYKYIVGQCIHLFNFQETSPCLGAHLNYTRLLHVQFGSRCDLRQTVLSIIQIVKNFARPASAYCLLVVPGTKIPAPSVGYYLRIQQYSSSIVKNRCELPPIALLYASSTQNVR